MTLTHGVCLCGRGWWYTGDVADMPACSCGRTATQADVRRAESKRIQRPVAKPVGTRV